MEDQDQTQEEKQEFSITSESDLVQDALQLLPVHAAPQDSSGNVIKVTRGRGRPRKVARMPTTRDLEYHALMTEAKAKAIDSDTVVKAAIGRADTPELLRLIKVEIAKEAAALRCARIENEKFGRDTSAISSRRIDALNKVAAIEFEIRKLGADVIDLHGERFQKVFQMWIGTLKDIAQLTLTTEQVDLLFNRLETALDGWEEKAAEAVSG